MIKRASGVTLIFMFVLIVAVPDIEAGVREEVRGIFTAESLRIYYESNGVYKKRYVLKELPEWLKLRGYSAPPPWVEDALIYAVNSNEPMLTMEAAVVTGLFKYQNTFITMPLLSKWIDAYNQFAADAERVRSAIAQMFLQLGGPLKDSVITVMFTAKPRYLHDAYFMLLLANITPQGCDRCADELNEIKREATKILSEMEKDPVNTPPREKRYYQQLLGLVKETQNRFSRR